MSDTDTIKVGQRKYKLGPTLGVGGFSEVKKGIDEETRKRVALKIMYTDDSNQSERKNQLNQVQKEIKAMKQLAHPNIIRLLGYDLKCEVGGRPAIVMVQQLAPKGELFDYLMYTKNFKQDQAVAVFHQLMAGLEAMHKAGIAHRDLKPENLLFDNNYNLKLADFGFSFAYQKGEGPKTAMRTELGTKGYMAPEIINNQKYTEKADIFASGVILFIMLAGFPPFQNAVKSDWWFDKLTKKKYKLFWMAHERTAKFSPEAKDILQKMLAPKDADRPSVQEVKETKFYNLSTRLSKEDIQRELKRRKKKVDEEKKKESKQEGVNRDLLFDLLKDLPEAKKPVLPNKPLLLGSLLENELQEQLSKIVNSEGDYRSAVLEALNGLNGQNLIVEEVDEAAKDKTSEEVWLNFAKTALDGAKMSAEDFQKQAGLSSSIAEELQKALRRTRMGDVDDWKIVSEFAQLDNDVVMAQFASSVLNNSFKTDASFGLVAYCLYRFVNGKGKIKVKADEGKIYCTMTLIKKVILPFEKEGGEIEWKKGKLKTTLKMDVGVAYCDTLQKNIITFRNTSEDAMTMQEFMSCVNEITTNAHYQLSKFITGRVEEEEFASIGAQYMTEEEITEIVAQESQ